MEGYTPVPKNDLKIGTFLVENGVITPDQLTEALSLQKDNPGRIIGEILVTQGLLSKEELIMAIEMYVMTTGNDPAHADEWLDQEEVDMLIEKIREKQNS